jgi:hypothetical protein
LGREFASRALQLSLHCVDQEEPHWDEGQGSAPHAVKARHPAFYGCFDWHSAAHGHWAMLRAADVVPDLPEKDEVVRTLSRHLTAANLRGELAFLEKNPGFEEPYGWGWMLRLGEELRRSTLPEARGWVKAVGPLERFLVRRMERYLAALREPNRVGMHDNTAFAMVHAWDYAREAGNEGFRKYLEKRARELYLPDHDCPLASEPGPTDFLSPCFEEADLMRRVLAPEEFRAWYSAFLPDVKPGQLEPVAPSDPTDYYQVHLVGLMYSKSSAMSGVAAQLEPGDPRRTVLLDSVQAQIDTAGRLMFGSGYGGTHWLASFAIYYYSGVGL